MQLPRATCLLLEEIAANAIAASTVQLVDGWLLRVWREAPFRRCNSVLPIRGDARGVETRVAIVEDFYRRRGMPVRFQIGAVCEPRDLEARLARRGYATEARTLVQVATVEDVLAATARDAAAAAAPVQVETRDAPDAAFVADAAPGHGDEPAVRRRVGVYADLLARVGPRSAAVLARGDGGAPVGLGFVVAERGWAGVFGMGTRPEARRHKVATAVLRALVERARGLGARRVYLQVEAENLPALALYARAGFDAAYGYHYRSLDL